VWISPKERKGRIEAMKEYTTEKCSYVEYKVNELMRSGELKEIAYEIANKEFRRLYFGGLYCSGKEANGKVVV